MIDASIHELPESIIRDSISCRPEILFGLLLSRLFILQNLLSHRRKQPKRQEEGTKRRRLSLFELAVEAEQ